jgi:hypothetical protein
MAVRGPKAQALAAEVADTVTFVQLPGESRVEVARLARDFRAIRDVELALHVSVIGDTVAPFMAPPDTDPPQQRAARTLWEREPAAVAQDPDPAGWQRDVALSQVAGTTRAMHASATVRER